MSVISKKLMQAAAAISGTPWDISTLVFTQDFFFSETITRTPQGVFFKPDGSKMYVAESQGDDVDEYSLSTAWDVSTSSYNARIDISGIVPSGVFLRSDGLKMYVTGISTTAVNESLIKEYNLGTAWSVSTAVEVGDKRIDAFELSPRGVFFKPDGLKGYIVGIDSGDVSEFDLGTAWTISTLDYGVTTFDLSSQVSVPTSIFFRSDGLKMYVLDRDVGVDEFDLGTAWSVSTASFNQSFSLSNDDNEGLFFKPDGLKMYTVSHDGFDQKISEYTSE